MRRQLGLDRPVLEQLVLWIARLAQGDFGTSLILNQSVVSAVVERLPITLSLALVRSEEHTSELQSLMRISYAVFCLKKKKSRKITKNNCNNRTNYVKKQIQ